MLKRVPVSWLSPGEMFPPNAKLTKDSVSPWSCQPNPQIIHTLLTSWSRFCLQSLQEIGEESLISPAFAGMLLRLPRSKWFYLLMFLFCGFVELTPEICDITMKTRYYFNNINKVFNKNRQNIRNVNSQKFNIAFSVDPCACRQN